MSGRVVLEGPAGKGGASQASSSSGRALWRGAALILGAWLAWAAAGCAGQAEKVALKSDEDELRGSKAIGGVSAGGSTGEVKASYRASYALVVGINGYPKASRLSGAVRDAREVQRELERQGFKVEVLLDAEATRGNILKRLDGLLREKVGPDDRFVMYFAGHGHTVGDEGNAIGFLLPFESAFEDVTFTGISMGEVQDLFKISTARHAMFIADACYSGLALPKMRGEAKADVQVPGYLQRAVQERARVALVAGSSDQQVLDNWQGHGLFTYYLLAGWRGGADLNGDGVVASQELLAYVEDRVRRTAYEEFGGHAQVPHMARAGEGEMVFVGSALVVDGEGAGDPELAPEVPALDVGLVCDGIEVCREIGERIHYQDRPMQAVPFYEFSCDGGDGVSCVRLGEIEERVLGRVERAMELYKGACDQGLAEGCVRLGLLYELGPEGARDLKAAAGYFRQSCDKDGEGSLGCAELAELCKDEAQPGCASCLSEASFSVAGGCQCMSGAAYVEGRGCQCFDGALYDPSCGCKCLSGAIYVDGQGCACGGGIAYKPGEGCQCPGGTRYCNGSCIGQWAFCVDPGGKGADYKTPRVVQMLTKREVIVELKRHERFFEACGERAGVKGVSLDLEFGVEPSGRVSSVVNHGEEAPGALVECVRARLSKIRFPASDMGIDALRRTFEF